MNLITIIFPFMILLGSCTYSVSVMHTEGQASDMIDENQTASPDVSPTLNIPVKPI